MDNNDAYITAFDLSVQSRNLQMLKTILPYMAMQQQKGLALMIKYMELQKTAQVFSGNEPTLQACEVKNGKEKLMLMLSDISRLCTDKEKENIDMIINMMDMFSTYEVLFN